MEINAKSIKRWSVIGARPTFGQAVLDLASREDRLMVLTADVSTSAGLDRFRKQYPDRFLDVGIAEQNMMGIATGLATEGLCVITTTFAPFQSMRCLEQIRVYQGYMDMPVVMVGLASGIYHSYLGNTHCCFEDVGVFRSIPNIAIVTPADCLEIIKALEAAVKYEHAVYIRLPEGAGMPVIYKEDYDFRIGKANVLRKGTDIAILANGRMVNTALEVAAGLSINNISAEVTDFHTVKPVDEGYLDSIDRRSLIVTIEEHNVHGGLGSAVSEYMMQKENRPRLMTFGIHDFFPHAGDYASSLEQCGLTTEKIEKSILKGLGA